MAIGNGGVANAQTPPTNQQPDAQSAVTSATIGKVQRSQEAQPSSDNQEGIDNIGLNASDAFHGLSHMVSGLTNLDEEGRIWLESMNNKDRSIDLTLFTALAHSAKLHLIEDGNLLFSYQMDGNVYNHQITEKERAKLYDILKDGGMMPKNLQGSAIAQLFSKITVDQSMQNNIDDNLSRSFNNQNLNRTLHR